MEPSSKEQHGQRNKEQLSTKGSTNSSDHPGSVVSKSSFFSNSSVKEEQNESEPEKQSQPSAFQTTSKVFKNESGEHSFSSKPSKKPQQSPATLINSSTLTKEKTQVEKYLQFFHEQGLKVENINLPKLQKNLKTHQIYLQYKSIDDIKFELPLIRIEDSTYNKQLNKKIVKYKVIISVFAIIVRVSYEKAPSPKVNFIKLLYKNSFGKIWIKQQNTQKSAVKRILFGKQQNSCRQDCIVLAIRQFAFNKLASCLDLGPQVKDEKQPDIRCYNDCVEFDMAVCQPLYTKQRRLSNQQIKKQLSSKLLLLHELHISPCDIKPQNVMFAREKKQCIYIDFGLSQIVIVNYEFSSIPAIPGGTPGFMLPQMENIKKFKRVNMYYNDVYALQKTIKKIQQCQDKRQQQQVNTQKPNQVNEFENLWRQPKIDDLIEPIQNIFQKIEEEPKFRQIETIIEADESVSKRDLILPILQKYPYFNTLVEKIKQSQQKQILLIKTTSNDIRKYNEEEPDLGQFPSDPKQQHFFHNNLQGILHLYDVTNSCKQFRRSLKLELERARTRKSYSYMAKIFKKMLSCCCKHFDIKNQIPPDVDKLLSKQWNDPKLRKELTILNKMYKGQPFQMDFEQYNKEHPNNIDFMIDVCTLFQTNDIKQPLSEYCQIMCKMAEQTGDPPSRVYYLKYLAESVNKKDRSMETLKKALDQIKQKEFSLDYATYLSIYHYNLIESGQSNDTTTFKEALDIVQRLGISYSQVQFNYASANNVVAKRKKDLPQSIRWIQKKKICYQNTFGKQFYLTINITIEYLDHLFTYGEFKQIDIDCQQFQNTMRKNKSNPLSSSFYLTFRLKYLTYLNRWDDAKRFYQEVIKHFKPQNEYDKLILICYGQLVSNKLEECQQTLNQLLQDENQQKLLMPLRLNLTLLHHQAKDLSHFIEKHCVKTKNKQIYVQNYMILNSIDRKVDYQVDTDQVTKDINSLKEGHPERARLFCSLARIHTDQDRIKAKQYYEKAKKEFQIYESFHRVMAQKEMEQLEKRLNL